MEIRTAEYAKDAPNDVLIRLTIANRASDAATIHVLPSLWFRNTWAWGRTGEGYWKKPRLSATPDNEQIIAEHDSLDAHALAKIAHGNAERVLRL